MHYVTMCTQDPSRSHLNAFRLVLAFPLSTTIFSLLVSIFRRIQQLSLSLKHIRSYESSKMANDSWKDGILLKVRRRNSRVQSAASDDPNDICRL